MTVTDLFNFVIDQNIADEDVDGYLDKVSSVLAYNALPFNLSLQLSLYTSTFLLYDAITLYKHIPAV